MGRVGACIPCLPDDGMSEFSCAPSFPCPLLPALPPALHPCPPASPCARVQRSMFVTRGVAEYASQKEGAALHQNKNQLDLIGCCRSEHALILRFVLYF